MQSITVTPAYGRDYKSKKEALNDWNNNKDFVVATVFGGRSGSYIGKEEAIKAGFKSVEIRYAKLAKVAVVKL